MAKKERYLPAEDLALFCTQLTMMVRAAVPLEQGILIVEEQAGNPQARQMVAGMRETLEAGAPLSRALQLAAVFPPYLVQMVAIGEKSGNMDQVLSALARYYEGEHRREQAIRRAVIYPLVSILLMTAVMAVLVTQVLPVFQRVFTSLGQSSSTAVAAVRAGSAAGMAILGLMTLFALLILVGWLLTKNARGRHWIRRILPMKSVFAQIAAARTASVLQLQLAAGYPIEDALDSLPDLMEDEQAVSRIQACRQALSEGKSLPEALTGSGLFPGAYGKMAVLGCRTGSLDGVMVQLSEHYSAGAEEAIDRLIGMIEPTLVGILTILIGGVLLSVMLPLIGIMSAIG